MKSKNLILAALFGLLIIIGVGTLIWAKNGDLNQNEKSLAQKLESIENQTTPQSTESTKPVPDGAYIYELTDESLVRYIAQKRLLNQEIEMMQGVTNFVEGSGFFDSAENAIYLMAEVDILTLTTDSPKRDEDVQKLFTSKNATFVVDLKNVAGLVKGSDFTLQIPGFLTINEIEKEIVFDVSGRLDENEFVAEGSTKVLMSDFGITPPSLVGVSTVDDEIELQFDVVGIRR